jgi:hypothetical protein
VLFLEVSQLAHTESLWSDAIPGGSAGDARLGCALLGWRVAIACLALGLFTRPAALVNYAMTLATLATFDRFEYHVDYVFTTLNLLLLATPVSARLSLDRAMADLRRARAGLAPLPRAAVSELHASLLVVFGVGVVYFDSVFYKLVSPMWRGGLGMWLPASLPHVAWNDLGPLLDCEWLVKGLGWLTLAFEALFLALVGWRALRPWLLAVGLALHLGIALVFPIPWFGLAVAALYLLLVPAAWYEAAGRWLARAAARSAPWRAAARRLRDGVETLLAALPADAAASAGGPPRAVLVGLTAFLLASQAVATLQAPLVREVAQRAHLGAWLRAVRPAAEAFTDAVSRPLAGITRHGVFMDRHFRGYEHVIAVASVDAQGRETLLPLWDASGSPTRLQTGRLWVYWNWRAVGPRPDPARLADGVRRITAFWAGLHDQSLDDARFVVRVKRIAVPTGWERGWLRREKARPWSELARARWSAGRFAWEPHPVSGTVFGSSPSGTLSGTVFRSSRHSDSSPADPRPRI